jgi:5-methyltetrahydrofolate--homocysteine methyltransferase
MAFDENGQADTVEPVGIAHRATDLLTAGRLPAPGHHLRPQRLRRRHRHRAEHNAYGWTSSRPRGASRQKLPGVLISGGLSNVSFSFRGNDGVREAMHAAFLYHAIRAGMDMGIVNAGQLPIYEDLDPELLERVEDVLLNRRPDATERLVTFAETVKGGAKEKARRIWPGAPCRCASGSHALVKGINAYIEDGRGRGAAANWPARWT